MLIGIREELTTEPKNNDLYTIYMKKPWAWYWKKVDFINDKDIANIWYESQIDFHRSPSRFGPMQVMMTRSVYYMPKKLAWWEISKWVHSFHPGS
jgi:hypothetical protein